MYKLRTFIGKKGFIDAKCLTFEPTVFRNKCVHKTKLGFYFEGLQIILHKTSLISDKMSLHHHK